MSDYVALGETYDPVGEKLSFGEHFRGFVVALIWGGINFGLFGLVSGNFNWLNLQIWAATFSVGMFTFSELLGAKYPNLWRQRFSFKKNFRDNSDVDGDKGSTSTDAWLVKLFVFSVYLFALFCPFDGGRLQLTPPLEPTVNYIGAGCIFMAFLGISAVTRTNPFLFPNVKVEPGQTVISTGPYGWVRHPMYTCYLFFIVGHCLMFNSLVGLGVGLFSYFCLAMRTLHEETVLKAELPGYDEYMQKVRSRWIPCIL